MDRWLSRSVAVGLTLLALTSIAAYTYLKGKGVDASDLVALGGTAVGALAGFLTGVRVTPDSTES